MRPESVFSSTSDLATSSPNSVFGPNRPRNPAIDVTNRPLPTQTSSK